MYRYLCIPFLWIAITSHAQSQVEVKVDQNNQGEFVFTGTNHAYCDYTIRIEFLTFQNLKTNKNLPFISSVLPGHQRLFELEPVSDMLAPAFNFRYKTIKGRLKPDVDEEVIYLLPFKNGPVRVMPIERIESLLGQKAPSGFKAIGFEMDHGDTVFACRRGVVSDIQEQTDSYHNTMNYFHNRNFVEIFHEDGSFAKYEPLAKEKLLVHPGDFIEAGDPIGIVDASEDNEHTVLIFSNFYLSEIDWDFKAKKSPYNFQSVTFFTSKNSEIRLVEGKQYYSDHAEEYIIQEMSKRERKKWKKEKVGI